MAPSGKVVKAKQGHKHVLKVRGSDMCDGRDHCCQGQGQMMMLTYLDYILMMKPPLPWGLHCQNL